MIQRGWKKEGAKKSGRSRGELTTKVVALVDAWGRLSRFELLADRSFDGDRLRALPASLGAEAVVPPQRNRKEAIDCDMEKYAKRHRVDNFFCRIKNFRRISAASAPHRHPLRPDRIELCGDDPHGCRWLDCQVPWAGATLFVQPDDVLGTLERGFELCCSLEPPFQCAVFIHFLVAEAHPFAAGNGRMARIMMNAELLADGEERIVIPTVYRGNYLAAQRALTHNRAPEPLIRTLDYAQRWTGPRRWLGARWRSRRGTWPSATLS